MGLRELVDWIKSDFGFNRNAYLTTAILTPVFGAVILGPMLSFTGAFGSRGVGDVEKFEYQGKPVILQRDDIRFGPDQYQILLSDGSVMKSGTLNLDNGRTLELEAFRYSVRGD